MYKEKIEYSKQLEDNIQLIFLLWLTITNNLIEIFYHFNHTEAAYHSLPSRFPDTKTPRCSCMLFNQEALLISNFHYFGLQIRPFPSAV
jgi:hypothetical protein